MDNDWWSVTYGNGLFVAVASYGIGNGVMTSPDGINWTLRPQTFGAVYNIWTGVTYANGLFVAVAASGFGDRVRKNGAFPAIASIAGKQLWAANQANLPGAGQFQDSQVQSRGSLA